MSRARARLKFMVHDLGPEAFRARVEEQLGRKLEDGAVPAAPAEEHDHAGVHPQKQDGLFYAGFPVYLGLLNGEAMLRAGRPRRDPWAAASASPAGRTSS